MRKLNQWDDMPWPTWIGFGVATGVNNAALAVFVAFFTWLWLQGEEE